MRKKNELALARVENEDVQGEHSADNVKFPDGSQHCSVTLGMLSVTHNMPVLVLLSVVVVGMQQCMIQNHIFNLTQNRLLLNTCMNANMQLTVLGNFSLTRFPPPDTSLIFSKIPDISLTAVKFPDISRFSRQVVTLDV